LSETPSSYPFVEYRRRALGCWLGKAVGGTLGGPYEGHTKGTLSLTFYDPVPDRMLPNDDLDLQVVWAEAIRRHGLPIHRRMLADAWLRHIQLLPDEYGVAVRNLAAGIYPPASGAFDNGFTAGMGAAIRTELWACLAPGDPDLAVAFAREDACVDHDGEGVHAAVYLAALESLAFVERDRETLLDAAAAYLPADSRVARAIADTRRLWAETGDWREVRERVFAEHGTQNFTDVAQNLAFTVLGWLAGGDFGEALCIAVNCGMDTDCTGATLGALLGILDPDSIGEAWLKPIGRELVLSPGMVAMPGLPATLDAFTDLVAGLAVAAGRHYGAKVTLEGVPADVAAGASDVPVRSPLGRDLLLAADAPTHQGLLCAEPLVVSVIYPADVALTPGVPASLTLRFTAPADLPEGGANVSVRPPSGWTAEPAAFRVDLKAGETTEREVRVTAPAVPGATARPSAPVADLLLSAGGLSWHVEVGLPLTLPVLLWPEGEEEAAGEVREVAGHFIPLPEGACALTAEFKMPYRAQPRFVVQTPGRAVRVFLNGELLHEHEGTYRVPAIHRPGNTWKQADVNRGWHRLTIRVAAGDPGPLFIGIGDGGSWDWVRGLEWRVPGATAQ